MVFFHSKNSTQFFFCTKENSTLFLQSFFWIDEVTLFFPLYFWENTEGILFLRWMKYSFYAFHSCSAANWSVF